LAFSDSAVRSAPLDVAYDTGNGHSSICFNAIRTKATPTANIPSILALSKSPHDLVEFQVGEAIDPIVGKLGTSPTKSFPSTTTTPNVSPPNFEPPTTLTLINDHEPSTKPNTRVESSFSFVSAYESGIRWIKLACVAVP
jgi:hypothetical protein